MSENTINYQDFQPDWWDNAGATAEAVKAGIDDIISKNFWAWRHSSDTAAGYSGLSQPTLSGAGGHERSSESSPSGIPIC